MKWTKAMHEWARDVDSDLMTFALDEIERLRMVVSQHAAGPLGGFDVVLDKSCPKERIYVYNSREDFNRAMRLAGVLTTQQGEED